MLTIRLLGPPAIERDDVPIRPPRGRKAWALLAYLVFAERPRSRQHLAQLLFGEADDPLGALRWSLAELRRTLGLPSALAGDPVALALGDGVAIDVRAVTADGSDPTLLLAAGGELLEGVKVSANPEFESWLLVERHRVSAAIEGRLRHAAVTLLTASRAAEAVPYASQAVASNPLEEGNHELLVRCLAMAGDRAAAERQIAVCQDLLRRELGVEASDALRDAATAGPTSGMVLPLSGRAAALSQLEAGRAAILAGAADAGIQCLRRAVAEANRCGDDALHARALAALGGALVHAVKGRDEEGAIVLHEAIGMAERAGDRVTAVAAHRELGFIEVQAGRRKTADLWLRRAEELAETAEQLAPILGVRGMNSSDMGDYPAAFVHLGESVDRARSCADERQQAFSLSLLARAHLLRGERSQALGTIGESLDLVQRQRWLAFLPWPQAIRAELDLRSGDLGTAADQLEQSWALACQIGDPCWESMAARGMGLLHAIRGDHPVAATWLAEAAARAIRVPDRYQWVHGYVLDAAIANALDNGETERAAPLVANLASLAARAEMRELLVRAQLHRHRLGDGSALAAARMHAADISNPALEDLLRAA
jgi:DNA-binding SARP family transcriptional activator